MEDLHWLNVRESGLQLRQSVCIVLKLVIYDAPCRRLNSLKSKSKDSNACVEEGYHEANGGFLVLLCRQLTHTHQISPSFIVTRLSLRLLHISTCTHTQH